MPRLSETQRDLIERIGILHDKMGMRPAEGRIVGLLIVSSEPELTFDEIRLALELSKSATSTALRHLQEIGSIEYRTRPGDRKRYFRKNYADWERSFIERGVGYLQIRHLLSEARAYQDPAKNDNAQSMDRMIDFLEFLEESVLDAHKRWEEKTSKSRAAGARSKAKKPRR